ncbi:hypothetical protein N9H93_01505 [Rhizobiaceae bacterium]|nr:hypothetical protein [Rhizobiaceae bacterium]
MSATATAGSAPVIDVATRPAIAPGYHVRTQVSTRIEASPSAFFDWYMTLPIETFMLAGRVVTAVSGTTDSAGSVWGEKLSSRTVHFTDGTAASEAIVKIDLPEGYEYQVWDFTGAVKFLADYGLAAMSSTDVDASAKAFTLVWDYAFKPKNIFTRPLTYALIHADWTRTMQRAADGLAAHVSAHGATGIPNLKS